MSSAGPRFAKNSTVTLPLATARATRRTRGGSERSRLLAASRPSALPPTGSRAPDPGALAAPPGLSALLFEAPAAETGWAGGLEGTGAEAGSSSTAGLRVTG